MQSITTRITPWLESEAARRGPAALMPTVAETCERFGINGVGTVRAAYAPLIESGLVERLDSPRRWAVTTPAAVGPRATPAQSATHAQLDELAQTLTHALDLVETLRHAS